MKSRAEQETRTRITRELMAGRGQAPGADRTRLAWWREARFGMFIHWGLYTVPAGKWNGKDVPGLGEWIMHRRRIPVRRYEQLARHFVPGLFDAEKWVRLAARAGMKYIVITAKHHEGFAMFRSAADPYNIAAATPWGRDPMGELSRACARHGVRLCFYYSQDQDWHHPDGAWNDWDFDASGKDFDRYFRQKVIPQVTELLTHYGPVGALWFDTPYTISRERSQEIRSLVSRLQPGCLVSGRIGHDLGDYGSLGDNEIPLGPVGGDYETPVTMNDTWGFKAGDRAWKSTRSLLLLLVDLASKGINCLLNVGPRADGAFPRPAVTRLKGIAAWMGTNGEAIHGTSAGPFPCELPWGRVTVRPGRLYLHIFQWPEKELVLRGLQSRVRAAWLLGDPRRHITVAQHRDRTLGYDELVLSDMPSRPHHPVPVIALAINGTARVQQALIQQQRGATFLPSSRAERRGPAGAGIPIARAGNTDGWKDTGCWLSWTVLMLQPGTYRASILSSSEADYRGVHRMRLAVRGASETELRGPLVEHERSEGLWTRYVPQILTHAGLVGIAGPGRYSVHLRADVISNRAPQGIGVFGIRLEAWRTSPIGLPGPAGGAPGRWRKVLPRIHGNHAGDPRPDPFEAGPAASAP